MRPDLETIIRRGQRRGPLSLPPRRWSPTTQKERIVGLLRMGLPWLLVLCALVVAATFLVY